MKTIQERELDLERDKKAWRVEKNELTIDVQHLTLEKKSLLKKVAPLRTRIEGLQRAIDNLIKIKSILETDNADLKIKISDKNNLIKELDVDIEVRESKVQSLKTEINSGLREYELNERAKIDKSLESSRQLKGTLEEELEELRIEIESALMQAEAARTDAQTSADGLEQVRKSVLEQKEVLGEELRILKSENQRFRDKNRILVGQNTDLSGESFKLNTKNEDLKAYEVRAWKVLNAKDEELQNRERALSEREQFVPSSKSFLPPVL